jgi:hypothetical protein
MRSRSTGGAASWSERAVALTKAATINAELTVADTAHWSVDRSTASVVARIGSGKSLCGRVNRQEHAGTERALENSLRTEFAKPIAKPIVDGKSTQR